MSRSTKKHLIISLGLLLIALGSLLFTMYQISKKADVLARQIEVLGKEQAHESSFYRLQKIFGETKNDRDQVSGYFLKQGSDSIDFLNSVEAMAPKEGVMLKTESLEERVDNKTGKKWIEVQFFFSGTQNNVERFIKILEHLPYFSQVTSLSMVAKTEAEWEARLSMKIFIATYDTEKTN